MLFACVLRVFLGNQLNVLKQTKLYQELKNCDKFIKKYDVGF